MTAQRFLWGAVVAGFIWRVWLALPATHWDSSALSIALGMLPYLVVVAFSRLVKSRALLGVAALVAIVTLVSDIALGLVAIRSTSSTAGVALLLVPIGKALVLALLLAIALVVTPRAVGDQRR